MPLHAKYRKKRAAYSLIELMVVLGILAALFAMAVGAYISWGRTTAIDTGTRNCMSNLALARQWAVTHRATATVEFMNDGPQGVYTLINRTNENSQAIQLTPTNRLPESIVFVSAPEEIHFHPDGTASWDTDDQLSAEIIIREYGPPENIAIASTITVSRLTGHAGVVQ